MRQEINDTTGKRKRRKQKNNTNQRDERRRRICSRVARDSFPCNYPWISPYRRMCNRCVEYRYFFARAIRVTGRSSRNETVGRIFLDVNNFAVKSRRRASRYYPFLWGRNIPNRSKMSGGNEPGASGILGKQKFFFSTEFFFFSFVN